MGRLAKETNHAINENKLNMMEPTARQFLEQSMSAYLFDGVEPTIEGYVPPEK